MTDTAFISKNSLATVSIPMMKLFCHFLFAAYLPLVLAVADARAEAVPTLESCVADSVLIVKARQVGEMPKREGQSIAFEVLENWKGRFKPSDFVKLGPGDHLLAYPGEHGVNVVPGQEIVFFYSRWNQPDGKLSRHNTAIPILNGRMVYGATSDSEEIPRNLTVEEFKKLCMPTTELAAIVGKDKEALQKNHSATLAALTGKLEESVFDAVPWHVWSFHTAGNETRYVVFSGRKLFAIPGDCGANILLLSANGERLGSWDLMTGYRADLASASFAYNDLVKAQIITISTEPAKGGSGSKQYFGFVGDRLYFMRVECPDGVIETNHYLSPNFTLGGPLPAEDLAGWTALLQAPELPKRLSALTYLAGIHMDPDKPREGIVSESIENAKLARDFRRAEATGKAVTNYLESEVPWLKEAAEAAIKAIEETR
jgi:hypothetical protein